LFATGACPSRMPLGESVESPQSFKRLRRAARRV
jgi:hypothetical protein